MQNYSGEWQIIPFENLIGSQEKIRYYRKSRNLVCMRSPEIPGFPRARE